MTVANHLSFLEALDRHVRASPSGCVTHGSEMYGIATRAGLASHGDQAAARWTGELVYLGFVRWGSRMGGDPLPEPAGASWTDRDLQRFFDYRVTSNGHREADRIRRLRREDATDIALGVILPPPDGHLALASAQREAIHRPMNDLRAALDDGRAPAAIGAAKELVEAACKVALHQRGVPAAKSASLPSLFKEARRMLGVTDGDIGRSLAATVQRLSELRNAVGAGHGAASAPEVTMAEARLAASAATGIATLLLGTS